MSITPKSNLFIVRTHYQYLCAVNICLSQFNTTDTYNYIYYWETKTLRIVSPLSIDDFNGMIIPISPANLVAFAKEQAQKDYRRYFLFQEGNILNKYIAYKLKKKGTIICLGPDGTKPYGVFKKKYELFSVIKDTFRDYFFLYKNRLWIYQLMFSWNYRYGSSPVIDEVWLPYPLLFDAKHNKVKTPIVTLPELTSKNVKEIAKTFAFNKHSFMSVSGNILYLNQPFWSDLLFAREMELLNHIIQSHAPKTVFIKLHPATSTSAKEIYFRLHSVVLIEDAVPAELYIASISNTICITGWSTALMHPMGADNRYYYLYPLYKTTGDQMLSQINLIDFPHIKMVNSLSEIETM